MKRRLINALGLIAGLTSCTEVTVVATVPTGAAGDSAIGASCIESSECVRGAFCERQKCEEFNGVCTALPTGCPSEVNSVCGCNGITYANECIRRMASVGGSSTNGACDRDGG